MALQFSTTLRNDRVSCLGTASVTPVSLTHLTIFQGAVPANCAAADPATALATISPLPSPYLTFSGGVTTIANAGSWTTTGLSAAGAGTTAQSFRMYDTGGTCHVQGVIGTDLVLNNASIANGQTVSVTSFTVTDGNA